MVLLVRSLVPLGMSSLSRRRQPNQYHDLLPRVRPSGVQYSCGGGGAAAGGRIPNIASLLPVGVPNNRVIGGNCTTIGWRRMVWNQQQRPYSKTIITHDNNSDSNMSISGDEIYQRALAALREATELEEQLEQERNRQLYKAFQKQEEELKLKQQQEQHDNDPTKKNNATQSTQRRRNTSGGVAVVKTIAKQTRETMGGDTKQQLQPHELKRQEGWDLMEVAALRYGHKDALVRLGAEAATSLEDRNLKLAKMYFQEAGEKGSPDGWFNLGNLLWQESERKRSTPIIVAAFDAFDKAIELGDADAMYFVGQQYLSNDDDGETDLLVYQLGLKLVQDAADKGHSEALYYLALFYLNGNKILGVKRCSTSEFLARLDKACLAGSPDALFLRGHAYYHGDHGLVESYPLALADFLSAAEAGHADAAVSAGAMLHQGIGTIIPRDQRRAFQLYQEAGELGSKEGWRNVVACYAYGEGVPQSKAMAQHIAKLMLKDDEYDDDEDDDPVDIYRR